MIRYGRVEVTGGFLLLAAWMNYLDQSFLVPMAALACAVHELGHYAVICLFRGDVKLIRLTAIGVEMVLGKPLGYWQEGLSALAGPAVSLLLALSFCGFEHGLTFAGLNFVLAIFNLMPVHCLDGGRALYCTLALLTGQESADRASRWLDCLCTGAALGIGVFLAGFRGNITLILVGVWLTAAFLRQNIFSHSKNTQKIAELKLTAKKSEFMLKER